VPFADRYTEDATFTIGRETLPVFVRLHEIFDVARGRSTEVTANESRRVPIQMEEGRRLSGGRLWINDVSPFFGWHVSAHQELMGTLVLADGTTFDIWLQDWQGSGTTFIADFLDAQHRFHRAETDED